MNTQRVTRSIILKRCRRWVRRRQKLFLLWQRQVALRNRYEMRLIILDDITYECAFELLNDHIRLLLAIDSRLRVRRSKLKSTNGLIALQQSWFEGRLKHQIRLRIETRSAEPTQTVFHLIGSSLP